VSAWYSGTNLEGRSVLALNIDEGEFKGRRITVARHGEGRKYWGVTYPDGTYEHSALSQTEAKQQAEAWRPDKTIVALVDEKSVQADAAPASDVSTSGGADFAAAAGITSGALDAVELVDLVVQNATGRDIPRGGRGWGYQDAGDGQRRALVAIEDLAALRSAIDNAIRAQVAVARNNTGSSWYSNAATWADIGAALGVTKQSAQAKYGRTG
jgi:hypothetical protein